MNDNIVYIGNKPPMDYILAIMRFFNTEADAVVLKARGRAISRAVDVAEIARRRFMNDIQTSKIEIDTEQMQNPEGGTRGVSTISITMSLGKESKPEIKQETKAKTIPPTHGDLSEIKGVGEARAEKLKAAGFTTVESIAKSKTEKLAKAAGFSEKMANNIIEAAKELLKEK